MAKIAITRPADKQIIDPKTGRVRLEWDAFFGKLEDHVADAKIARTAQSISTDGAALAIDLANGYTINLDLANSITSMTFTHPPSIGVYGVVTFIITQSGAKTISGWPTGTIWAGGTAPTITATAGRVDIITLSSLDGGTTCYGAIVAQDLH